MPEKLLPVGRVRVLSLLLQDLHLVLWVVNLLGLVGRYFERRQVFVGPRFLEKSNEVVF